MTKLIILDRDGVINHDSDHFIKSELEWQPIPGSLEAIVLLNQANYKVHIASNQSGIARGLLDLLTLKAIHNKMESELKTLGGYLDGIHFCPHGPSHDCDCRKPKPGLIHSILNLYPDICPSTVYFVGDTERDLEAALNAQCKPILVLTGKDRKTQQNLPLNLQTIPFFPDLNHFVVALLK